MNVLRIILTILFALDSLLLTIVVLMQEGKSSGLGALSGASEGFWGQNQHTFC